MEIDGYDAIDPHYMMMHEAGGTLRGCWRLLPTQGPYMLKDTFPQLLYGQPAPDDPKIWEISRFAVATDAQQVFGFSEIALRSIREVIEYGHRQGIEHYVMATTTAIERMLRRAGLAIRRFGPPMVVGVETTIGLCVDIGASLLALNAASVALEQRHHAGHIM
jgi:acyl homoserine lactone synthase